MLVLASASPRRAEALRKLGITFQVRASHVDETPPPGADAATAATNLALRKATSVRAGPDEFILAADTIVALGTEFFGKPKDARDAIRILTMLSGRIHDVATGIAVIHGGRSWTGCEVAHVKFRRLDPVAIERYVATGEPIDKAGAYAVQGGAASFVESIDGEITTVVGLPIQRTLALLKTAGFPLPPHLEP